MVKKIHCDVDGNDWVKAKVSDGGDLVFIQMAFRGSFSNVMLSTVNAQKLLKQIKRALEIIEDSDNGNGLKFSVGDKVRIVGNTLRGIGFGHHFVIGSIVEILKIAPGAIQPYSAGNGAGWLASEDIEPA